MNLDSPIFTKTLNSACFGTVLSSPYFSKFPALISWNLHVFYILYVFFVSPYFYPCDAWVKVVKPYTVHGYASHYWTPMNEDLLVLCIHACTCRPMYVTMYA